VTLEVERDGRGPHFSNATLVDAILRSDFASFVQQCFYSLTPGVPFLPNWHIEALAFYLEQVRLGKIRRLIICMPPRSLKSIVASVAFPAYLLGHDPTKRIITASYAADLAIKHAADFRAVMMSDWYLRAFPNTRISRMKNTETEVATTRRGYRLSTSIDGALTGRGGSVIVIDDPLKPADALSDSKRERVNAWFYNTLLSRLDDKRNGAIVLVQQRLHQYDLVGTLLQRPEEWTVLNLAAIAEEEERIQIGDEEFHIRRVGDLLHAAREPQSVLDALKAQLGSDTFWAQYQQAPVPPGGNMIKRDWLCRYDALPPRTYATHVVQSWDTASKEGGENDFSVCTTWLVHAGKYYLIDLVRKRLNYPDLKALAIAHARAHKVTKILIEDTGVGTALVTELQRSGLQAVGVNVKGDKKTRMSVQSSKFESGEVLFPKSASWLEVLEAELFAFPGARHDDQVDSISQALTHAVGGYDTTGSWW
jgi:predicted phage terminase large subunit-like protein